MKEILNGMVQVMGDQAIALGTVADQVAALKQTLASKFPEIADELKGQVLADQEQNRNDVYEVQVSLAKLREAISQLSEAEPKVERKRKASRASSRARKS